VRWLVLDLGSAHSTFGNIEEKCIADYILYILKIVSGLSCGSFMVAARFWQVLETTVRK
jgi:hypothetical protein